ncbi:serine/threonine-protein kinase [Actinomadura sp. WMMB 499]|uniref:serine/threonine-protein kinase n=1 Tax=Actinomadura sp. WMMB 499 TaxID=1219491 RepID=UPI00159D805D|nr:serine/threonine protein kinase [Actinomadura sp. WMMB 499]
MAIKYLVPGADPAARELFRHEARMLARVRHPNVARLYRLFEDADESAIVMEVVDGVSLKRILADRGALTPEASLLLLKGSLLGLAAAHAEGVVHRDYKPANVVVGGDGLSKLIDFGVAARAGGGGRAGTPAYMAPEQWRGEPAAPAADVYAAACVFYECVTGHRPYASRTGPDLMAAHVREPVPVRDVPEPLRGLVARGLAKSPADRPPGAAAFAAELEDAATRAYGPGWEDRAVRALALAAAALASAFPLAAAALPAPAAGATAVGDAMEDAMEDAMGEATWDAMGEAVPDAAGAVLEGTGATSAGGVPAAAKAALAVSAVAVTAAVVAAVVFGTADRDEPARRTAVTPTATAPPTAPVPSPSVSPATAPPSPAHETPAPTHSSPAPEHETPTPTHTSPSPDHGTPTPPDHGTPTPPDHGTPTPPDHGTPTPPDHGTPAPPDREAPASTRTSPAAEPRPGTDSDVPNLP